MAIIINRGSGITNIDALFLSNDDDLLNFFIAVKIFLIHPCSHFFARIAFKIPFCSLRREFCSIISGTMSLLLAGAAALAEKG